MPGIMMICYMNGFHGGPNLIVYRQSSVAWLEMPFEEEVIHQVIRKMSRDKALGPNGFIETFSQS